MQPNSHMKRSRTHHEHEDKGSSEMAYNIFYGFTSIINQCREKGVLLTS